MTEVFIVGSYNYCPCKSSWELVGVHSTRERAESACIFSHYFVVPVSLDKDIPLKPIIIGGSYYPHMDKKVLPDTKI
jgi:hypothetical protein